MCPAMVKKKLCLEVPLALLRLGTDSLTETVALDVGPESGFPKVEHQKDKGRWFQKILRIMWDGAKTGGS